jgi:hypothetical protein
MKFRIGYKKTKTTTPKNVNINYSNESINFTLPVPFIEIGKFSLSFTLAAKYDLKKKDDN